MPTSSYWYVITLPDGRTFTGWVLVKNNTLKFRNITKSCLKKTAFLFD
ncbi:hypothetical protein [Chryseobacterium indoltheticum]